MKKLTLLALCAAALCACVRQGATMPANTRMQLSAGWEFAEADTQLWRPATVPGTVHTDLYRAGAIEDPFWRDNEKRLQWIDKRDWIYRTHFTLDASALAKNRMELLFEGLDTYARVSVNGCEVLAADNMFRSWCADIKHCVHAGENELVVYFDSPVKVGVEKYDAYPYRLYANEIADQSRLGGLDDKQVSVHIRKTPSHFGWDWGPRFVTSGIWKPVWLCSWDDAKITDVHYLQQPAGEKSCDLTATVSIEAFGERSATVEVRADGRKVASKRVLLAPGGNSVQVGFTIRNPRLWWPSGMGEQPLYRLETAVKIDGAVADADRKNIGIRTVRLVQEPDRWGRSFYLEVNGVPMFAKGANVIPLNSFIPECGREDYVRLVENAVAANMNTLRIWGGGCYGDDALYDACDSLGVLVWQDFMFACSMYPTDDEFLRSVEAEAVDNVRRLRNHPSLALWCGNNEMGQGWWNWGWRKQTGNSEEVLDEIWKGYERIFHEALPALVAEHDPGRFYWPTSPCSDVGKSQNHESGDTHYWAYRNKQLPYSVFRHEKGRFMSEYGFIAVPPMKSYDKFLSAEDRDLFSGPFLTHVKCPTEPELTKVYSERYFAARGDFASQVYCSQLFQYDALKFTIEQHRLSRPFCMGSLVWQINDCWPVASWSTIDYYGEWKAGHYSARRSFEPTIVAADLDEQTQQLAVYGITDKPEPIEAELVCRLTDFAGGVLSEYTAPVRLDASASTQLWQTGVAELLGERDRGEAYLWYAIVRNGETLAENTLFFTQTRNLKLRPAQPDMRIEQVGGEVRLTLCSPVYVRGVEIAVPDEGAFVGDNYFDLLPGVNRTVTVRGCSDPGRIVVDHYLNHRE